MEEYSTNKAGKYLANTYFCHTIIILLNKKVSRMAPETAFSIPRRPQKLLAPHLKYFMIFLKETELKQCPSAQPIIFPSLQGTRQFL